MFEIWGRAIYRRRVLALVIALIALAGCRRLGHRRIRLAAVFGRLHPAEQREPAGQQPGGERVREK